MKIKGILFSLILVLSSCGKDNDLSGLVLNPAAATLIFPENLTKCFEGNIISPTESEVTFRWNASDNTDIYELHVSNLLNGSTDIYQTKQTELAVIILRGVPYSWFVVSALNDTNNTATSQTWSFYNAGEAVVSYIPFQAEPISPLPGTVFSNVSTISLSWQATDLDDDIISYDIYFGSSSPPEMYQADVTSASVQNIPVSPNAIYYWQISTKDEQGNESVSSIFDFEVN